MGGALAPESHRLLETGVTLPALHRAGLSAPCVRYVRAASWGQRTRGWADPRTRSIVVYWHPLWSRGSVEQTLLHELLHLSGRPGSAGHGPRFKALVLRFGREILGVELPEGAVRWRMSDLDYGQVWRRWIRAPWSAIPCFYEPVEEPCGT